MIEKINIIIEEEYKNIRIDQVISQYLNISREFIKKQTATPYINNNPVKWSYKAKVNDKVEWEYQKEIEIKQTLVPEAIPLNIIFEDEYLLVINKEAGLVVHPAKGHWTGTLSHALAYHLNLQENTNLRPGIVHRLDKDTSGLMVIAKTSEAQNKLSNDFKYRKLLKIYTALLQGHLPRSHDTITLPIGRSRKNRLLFCVDEIDGKQAISEYQVIEEFKKSTLVKVRIHTGRTHQIRVHFNYLGNPIIGDYLYSRWHKEPPLCLVATKLGFIHPISEEKMEFSIDLPNHIQQRINLEK